MMHKKVLAFAVQYAIIAAACSGCDGGPPVEPDQQRLTVAAAGTGDGTVTSQPAAITCTIASGVASATGCAADLDEGSLMTLTAVAATGTGFVGWSGGGCTGSGSCVVGMDQERVVTAEFNRVTHTLTVLAAGTGSGSVSGAPSGISCTVIAGTAVGTGCSAAYTQSTHVTLTATTAGDAVFTGWSGDCTGTGACEITLGEAHTVTASFQALQQLTVFGAGAGDGNVVSAPSGIDCDVSSGVASGAGCVGGFASGGVQLTATPASGNVFVGWGGACTGTGACVLVMDQARTVTAAFDPGPPPVIAFNSSVTGGVGACPLPPVGPGTRPATYVSMKFDYTDADGDVRVGASMTDVAVWQSGGSTETMVFPSPTITGGGFSGTITIEMCIRGDAGTSVGHQVTLTDAGGHASNQGSTTTTLQ